MKTRLLALLILLVLTSCSKGTEGFWSKNTSTANSSDASGTKSDNGDGGLNPSPTDPSDNPSDDPSAKPDDDGGNGDDDGSKDDGPSPKKKCPGKSGDKKDGDEKSDCPDKITKEQISNNPNLLDDIACDAHKIALCQKLESKKEIHGKYRLKIVDKSAINGLLKNNSNFLINCNKVQIFNKFIDLDKHHQVCNCHEKRDHEKDGEDD